MPMIDPKSKLESSGNKETDTWSWWNKLRSICANERRLSVGMCFSDTVLPELHIDIAVSYTKLF